MTTPTINLASPDNISAVPGAAFAYTAEFNAVPMAGSYTIFVHFCDAAGDIVFQDPDYEPSPTTDVWTGSVSVSRTVTPPAGTALGSYSMMMGISNPAAPFNRLPLTAGTGVTEDSQTRYDVGTVTVAAAASTPPPPKPVSIMGIGDSIMHGDHADAGGWLEPCNAILVFCGFEPTWLGSQTASASGSAPNFPCEGHPGFTIDQMASAVAGWIAAISPAPQIIVLMAGTNQPDPTKLDALVGQIFGILPEVRLVLNTIPLNGDGRESQINPFIPAIIAKYKGQSFTIAYCDAGFGLTLADLDTDNTHPLQTGYAIMGANVANTIGGLAAAL